MEEIRLNKYLSEMGVCSRREADRLIGAGKVRIDGRTAGLGDKVTEGQRVVCDGRAVGEAGAARPVPVLLAVHKPAGVVCTTSDRDRAPTIMDLVRYPERVYPAGRLDKDSSGLILMTNQGGLAERMMRGGRGHEKEYLVTVDRPVTERFLRSMEGGLWLEELKTRTLPCRAWASGEREFHLVLTQGLNRQIRRMCRALDYHVQSLCRVRIMNLWLGNLKPGTFRKVTPEEYRELLSQLDGGGARCGRTLPAGRR